MEDAKKITRRRYSAALKKQILAERAQPGASVASVAMSNGINANVVHKWRRVAGDNQPEVQPTTFVPVPLPPPTPLAAAEAQCSASTGVGAGPDAMITSSLPAARARRGMLSHIARQLQAPRSVSSD